MRFLLVWSPLLVPLLGKGLLTSEGEFWLKQRRLIQPAFLRQRIQTYADAMVAYTQRTVATWQAGETRDVYRDMVNKNEIALSRLKGICPLDSGTLNAYGVTGPLLRAAGDPWDLRKAMPYCS